MDKTVTLEEILECREQRAVYQQFLLEKYDLPIISFTVVMPGPCKQNAMSEKIFCQGKNAIESSLDGSLIRFKSEKAEKTGYEAFYVVDMPVEKLKKLTAAIEDGGRIGRLYDIDVIGKDGVPVSRTAYGLPERKCLICGSPAHMCSRSRKHSVDELLEEIEKVLKDE